MDQPPDILPGDEFSDEELEKLVRRTEQKARLFQALEKLDWITREEATWYLDRSLSSVDRLLKVCGPRIRTTTTGRNKMIFRPDLKRLLNDASIGGDEIRDDD